MYSRAVDPASAYRTDIDGLRALARGVVLLFHLEVAGFTGGSVGSTTSS